VLSCGLQATITPTASRARPVVWRWLQLPPVGGASTGSTTRASSPALKSLNSANAWASRQWSAMPSTPGCASCGSPSMPYVTSGLRSPTFLRALMISSPTTGRARRSSGRAHLLTRSWTCRPHLMAYDGPPSHPSCQAARARCHRLPSCPAARPPYHHEGCRLGSTMLLSSTMHLSTETPEGEVDSEGEGPYLAFCSSLDPAPWTLDPRPYARESRTAQRWPSTVGVPIQPVALQAAPKAIVCSLYRWLLLGCCTIDR